MVIMERLPQKLRELVEEGNRVVEIGKIDFGRLKRDGYGGLSNMNVFSTEASVNRGGESRDSLVS